MGIKLKIRKPPKPAGIIKVYVKLKRDGEQNTECFGCPYPQTERYCFPCMKKILGETEDEQIRKKCNEADGGT